MNMEQSVQIRISDDKMQAYISLQLPQNGEQYDAEQIINFLQHKGVKEGIIKEKIDDILGSGEYIKEHLIAQGKAPVDGVDGQYDFKFRIIRDNKPQLNEDGSVNYGKMALIECVQKDQVIVEYHPPIQGTPGYNINGEVIMPKVGKQLPPIGGKGFTRSEDNLIYTASKDGKIEYQFDKINITDLIEVNEDLDVTTTGNIDFKGDVIIHGSIGNGVVVRSGGTVTVDGNVEAAQIYAAKDIILKSGMQGGQKAYIKTGGNLQAKFIEHTKIDAKGDVRANVLMNCDINAGQSVIISGKRGIIVGGITRAVMGVEAMEIGNRAALRTRVYVGVDEDIYKRYKIVQKQVEAARNGLMKIEEAIACMENNEKVQKAMEKSDITNVSLLRAKIKQTTILSECQTELDGLSETVKNAQGAFVRVNGELFGGSEVWVDNQVMNIAEDVYNVMIRKKNEEIHMYNM